MGVCWEAGRERLRDIVCGYRRRGPGDSQGNEGEENPIVGEDEYILYIKIYRINYTNIRIS